MILHPPGLANGLQFLDDIYPEKFLYAVKSLELAGYAFAATVRL